jgi:hypothetical protein
VQESSAATHAGWGSNINHTSGGARAVVTDQRAPVINASFTGVSVVGNTATNQATTATNQNSGLGEAHNNLQPYTVVKWIICAASSSGNFDTEVQTALVTKVSNTALSQNYIINGGMDIWQRGLTVNNSGGIGYTADRFFSYEGVVSRFAGPPGIAFSARIQFAETPSLTQAIELPAQGNAGEFVVGSTWTLSFFARSAGGSNAGVSVRGYFATGVSGYSIGLFNEPLARASTQWTRYTHTFTIGAAPLATDKALVLVISVGNSEFYFDDAFITGVQLEAGTSATPFRRNAPSLQAELAACQRYFQSFPGGVGCSLAGIANTATQIIVSYSLGVSMRAPAVVAASGNIQISDHYAVDHTATSVILASVQAQSNTGGRIFLAGFTGLTVGRYYSPPGNGLGSGAITFSAEL